MAKKNRLGTSAASFLTDAANILKTPAGAEESAAKLSKKTRLEMQREAIKAAAEAKLQKLEKLQNVPSIKRGLPHGCRRATFVFDDDVLERLALYCKYKRCRKGDLIDDLLDKSLPSMKELEKKQAEADGKTLF